MKYLQPLLRDVEIAPVLADLEANPWVWDQRQLRRYTEAHREVSDVWVRFNDWKNFDQEAGQEGLRRFVLEEHEAVWYEEGDALPNLKTLIFELMCHFRAERLGTVLITRIPPGGQVRPHIDPGWAARFYEKIAVQLKSAPGQAFCYEDGEFSCPPGVVYTFFNSVSHWVVNPTEQERMTLIICIRRDPRLRPLWQGEADAAEKS